MSDSPQPPGNADRNLLFAVLALQLDFVPRHDLIAALQTWAVDRDRPLGEILLERAVLSPRRLALLEDVVQEYLAVHDMDDTRSLAAAREPRTALDLEVFIGPAMRGTVATLPSSPVTIPGPGCADPPLPSSVGPRTSLGNRFRVIRLHAAGALGEVYLARDEELNRDVALKQIRGAQSRNPDCRARFLLEAEITGSLEHPGIVPVHGLGFYPDGRPYYAMRFIRGESLHEAIVRFHGLGYLLPSDKPDADPSERALQLRGLLARFVVVCNAIDYAHSRGVVHRDIKPANIMLGPYGETLVVDWGLAKVFNEPITSDSREILIHPISGSGTATMLGQAVGTPSFMSPEQAAGRVDGVGPHSDVYSLGATLYNLLTGLPPYPGDNADVIMKDVMANKLVPPRRMNRDVPAALEAVILKAMSYQPVDRYGSVHELAEEIERWLADEPVKAYREPVWKQTQRWTVRHRSLVSGLAILLLTAVAGLGAGLWAVKQEQKQTAAQRDRAQANLRLAKDNLGLAQKAVDECFFLAKEEPLLQEEKNRALRKLLFEKALPFYRDFKRQKPDDAVLRAEYGLQLFRVADITAEIGQKSEAIKSFAQARDLFRDLVAQYPEVDRYAIDLARIADNLGLLQRQMVGQRQEAKASFLLALDLLEKVVRRQKKPEDQVKAELLSDLASTHNNLGVLFREGRERDQALVHYRRAQALLRQLAKRHPKDTRYQAALASAHHNIGSILADEEDRPGALEAYRHAQSIRERLARTPLTSGEIGVGSDYRIDLTGILTSLGEYLRLCSQKAQARSDLACTLGNLGGLYRKENLDKAFQVSTRALELRVSLVLQYPEVPEYQSDLASTFHALGVLHTGKGNFAEAKKSYQRAHAIQEHLVREYPTVTDYLIYAADTCIHLGNLIRDREKPEDALGWYGRVFELMREVLAKEPTSRVAKDVLRRAYWGRAETWTRMKRYKEAAADWTRAIAFAGEEDSDEFRHRRAYALAHAGDHAAAMAEVKLLEKADNLKGDALYNLACTCALAAAAVKRDGRLSAEQRQTQCETLSRHAVALLRRAFEDKEFRDSPDSDIVHKDEDLDLLRQREDFKKVIAGKQMP